MVKRAIRVFIVCFIVFFIVSGILYFPKLKAALSVERLADNLYTMEYVGDYGFDKFIKNGGASNTDDIASFMTNYLKFGCSTISTNSEVKYLARNFDWWSEPCTIMIMRTKPKNGYASISTVNLNFLNFGKDWKPNTLGNKFMSIGAIYCPLDGMNEKGLVIADLTAGDEEITNQNSGKPALTTTTAIRLLLDKAANVDEAIELLGQFDMNSDIGIAHHYAISDLSGRSVVVEYVDNKIYVKDTPTVANHYLTDTYKLGIGGDYSHYRQDVLNKALEDYESFGKEAILEAINRSANEGTRWQILFDQTNKIYSLYLDTTHTLSYDYSL